MDDRLLRSLYGDRCGQLRCRGSLAGARFPLRYTKTSTSLRFDESGSTAVMLEEIGQVLSLRGGVLDPCHERQSQPQLVRLEAEACRPESHGEI